jgi:hypothetical protein
LQAVIPREKINVFVAVSGLMAVGFHAAAGSRARVPIRIPGWSRNRRRHAVSL